MPRPGALVDSNPVVERLADETQLRVGGKEPSLQQRATMRPGRRRKEHERVRAAAYLVESAGEQRPHFLTTRGLADTPYFGSSLLVSLLAEPHWASVRQAEATAAALRFDIPVSHSRPAARPTPSASSNDSSHSVPAAEATTRLAAPAQERELHDVPDLLSDALVELLAEDLLRARL